MVSDPPGAADEVHCADVPLSETFVHNVALGPSFDAAVNVTEPLGVPLEALTVAVYTTDWPKVLEVGAAVTGVTVVVVAGFTVKEKVGPVFRLKLLSPL